MTKRKTKPERDLEKAPLIPSMNAPVLPWDGYPMPVMPKAGNCVFIKSISPAPVYRQGRKQWH